MLHPRAYPYTVWNRRSSDKIMDRSCRAAAEVSSEPGKHLGSISEPCKSVQLVYQCLYKLLSHLQELIRHYEIVVFHAMQSWRGCSQVLLSLDSLFVSLHKEKEWSLFHPISSSQFTFVQEENWIAVIFSVRLMLQSACKFLPTWESLQNGQEQVPGAGSVSVMKMTSGGRRRLDPEVIEDNWHISKKNVERGTEHPQYVHIHWRGFFFAFDVFQFLKHFSLQLKKALFL